MGSSRKVLRAVYCARLYGNNGHGLVDGVRCCAARVLRSARPEQISPMSREGRFLPRPRSLRVCMSHWLVHWRGLSRSRRLMDFNQGALTMVRLMWKRFSGCESGAILSAGFRRVLGLCFCCVGLIREYFFFFFRGQMPSCLFFLYKRYYLNYLPVQLPG